MASEGYEDADISVLEGMNHRTWHLDLPDVLEGSRVPLTRLFDYMPHVSAIEVRCGDRTTFVRRVFASDKQINRCLDGRSLRWSAGRNGAHLL
jgi:ArsR family metal-binding transcriptional regulator